MDRSSMRCSRKRTIRTVAWILSSICCLYSKPFVVRAKSNNVVATSNSTRRNFAKFCWLCRSSASNGSSEGVFAFRLAGGLLQNARLGLQCERHVASRRRSEKNLGRSRSLYVNPLWACSTGGLWPDSHCATILRACNPSA
jgi:hypothetical protein